MLIIFFDIKGTVHKEFVLADQTVNSAYYCDVLRQLRETVLRLRLEHRRRKELAVASRQRIVCHFISHPGTFDQTQHDCRPKLTVLFPVPLLKVKLKGRHFDTIEVIEAESQAVLNTLTEHGFQNAFKKLQKMWEQCKREEK
jgi:hypothetical protein